MSPLAEVSAVALSAAPAPTRITRVLVPYIATYYGGVRRVLEGGLPLLGRVPGLQVVYAELCRNGADMDAMERSGVTVDRALGVPGRSALGSGSGPGRAAAIAGQGPRLARMAWRLSRQLRRYDVCYLHGHREVLLAAAAVALLPASAAPALVWHWHGPPLSLDAGARGSWGAKAFARLGSRRCQRVIAISEFSAGLMERMGVARERISTVLNAVAVAPGAARAAGDRPLPTRAPGQVSLLLPCASIRRNKGVHLAVDALGRLSSAHVLWVTGDPGDPFAEPYVAELRRRATALRVADRLHFIGARPDVHAVMRAADVVLVPTVSEEPFGLVAAEAQLLGVPVVGSSRGALPEILGEGAGLVFDPDDAGALASAVARLEAEPGLRQRVVDAASSRARRLFSYDRWCREVAGVLVEADRARGPRASAAPVP